MQFITCGCGPTVARRLEQVQGRAIELSGVVPALTAEAAAAVDEADRVRQHLRRRAGVNPLGANGSFVLALL